MSTPLTPEQVLLLCDCFHRIDTNNDGRLDVSELDEFLKESFPEADDETLVQVRKIIIIEGDSNSDGKIDIKEFIDLISRRQFEAVLAALEATSPPESASVPHQQTPEDDASMRIKSILENLEPREIDVLRDAFIKLDTDGDGFLSRAELRRGLEERLQERFASSWPYLEKIFEVADWDHDDRLSIFEFLSSFADGPGVVPHEVVADCVENVKIRLTDEELETLRERFYEIDRNQDNFIDKEELFAAMKDVLATKYPQMADTEFEDIVSAVLATADADKDGKLNLSEFIRSYQEDQGVLPASFMGRANAVKRRLTRHEADKLQEAFSALDDNGDGFVDYGELYQAVADVLSATGLNDADTQDLVDTIMLTADRNRDGKLSLTEFIRNFVHNETLMTVAVDAAFERRAVAKQRLAEMTESGDLYKMVKLFCHLDANQDGFLDRQELDGILFRTLSEWYPEWTDIRKRVALDCIIEAADVDRDGRVSIDEFVRSYIHGYGILPVEVVREIAGHLHRNLTVEELGLVRANFVSLDANSDGFVSRVELHAAIREAVGPVVQDDAVVDDIVNYILLRVDSDRDDRISLKELIAACEMNAVPENADRPAEVAGDAGDEQRATGLVADGVQIAPQTIVPLGTADSGSAIPTSKARGEIDASSPIVNDVSKAAITDSQLRAEFQRFDTDGSGTLSKSEFKKIFLALEWCGLVPSQAEFEKLWRKFCGRDDALTYDEFCLFMLHRSRM